MTREFLELASDDGDGEPRIRALAARLLAEHGRLRMDSEGHAYNTCVALGMTGAELDPVAPLWRRWRLWSARARK